MEQARGVEPVVRVLGDPAADADAARAAASPRRGRGASASRLRIFSAAAMPCVAFVWGRTSRNSSPPKRPKMSSLRTLVVHEAGELLQELVAGEVAVRVVVVLEVVDVEQEHGESLRGLRLPGRALVVGGARGAVDELVERLLHVLLVVDAREAVHLRRRSSSG